MQVVQAHGPMAMPVVGTMCGPMPMVCQAPVVARMNSVTEGFDMTSACKCCDVRRRATTCDASRGFRREHAGGAPRIRRERTRRAAWKCLE